MVADDIERQQRGEKIPRVLTGISTADRVIGGCEPGDLVLVAARPGIGKSAFVGNVAAYCGMHQVPTFFFSVEMMLKKLGRRWISGDANINSNKLKRAEVDLDEWKKILKSGERFEEALLWANDAIIRLDQIIGESRRWHARHVVPRFAKSGRADDKRALLVVDYAQRVKIGRAKGDTREQEVAKVPTELKSLAKQLGCVIFLVVMLGREVERRGGDPILADLRESGAFEAEADIVLFLTHDATAGDRVIVAKNREGETGVAQCRWEKEITTWHALGSAEDYDGPDTRPSNWQDGREP
jgi:replicative DNA helicase